MEVERTMLAFGHHYSGTFIEASHRECAFFRRVSSSGLGSKADDHLQVFGKHGGHTVKERVNSETRASFILQKGKLMTSRILIEPGTDTLWFKTFKETKMGQERSRRPGGIVAERFSLGCATVNIVFQAETAPKIYIQLFKEIPKLRQSGGHGTIDRIAPAPILFSCL
jgi:hypothetical protein